jgi:pimeloyl-ACP methyl ester carboxylesterase
LQLATMYPILKATVAYVPANVRYPACCGFTPVPYAWSWKGKALGFRPIRPTPAQDGLVLRAVIEVEYIHGPVLLISGGEDRVWDSSNMASSIVARLKHFNFAHEVEDLKYPQAGHGAGRPEIVPAWQGTARNPVSVREIDMGGTPKGNAESSLDAIPRVLDFLQRNISAH